MARLLDVYLTPLEEPNNRAVITQTNNPKPDRLLREMMMKLTQNRCRKLEIAENDCAKGLELYKIMVAEFMAIPANRLQVLLAHNMIEMTPAEKLISLKWEFGKELTQGERDIIIDISKRELK